MELRIFAVAVAANLATLSAAFPLDTKLPSLSDCRRNFWSNQVGGFRYAG
jgi:hypothetical protein